MKNFDAWLLEILKIDQFYIMILTVYIPRFHFYQIFLNEFELRPLINLILNLYAIVLLFLKVFHPLLVYHVHLCSRHSIASSCKVK